MDRSIESHDTPNAPRRWYGEFMERACELVDRNSQSRLIIEPAFGCVATSWRVHDEELLALPAPRDAFLTSTRTGGIPLLYPYANRLRLDRFHCAGKPIDITNHPHLKRDAAGLPIHGLLLRWAQWKWTQTSDSTAQALLDWGEFPQLMDAFPFAHTLRIAWALSSDQHGASVSITTTIVADCDDAVPIAFGWHPYLAVAAPEQPSLTLPPRRSVALDPAGLPMQPPSIGVRWPTSTEAIGENQDHLFQLDEHEAANDAHTMTIECGQSRTEVVFGAGYETLQVYSPAHAPFVCIEPMTAQTSALTDGCRVVNPGESFCAAFSIRRCARALC